MTSSLLTESWSSVQRLVEELRPLMSRICSATEAEAYELRPELIKRLRALGHNCRLAKATSDALTKGVVTKPQGRAEMQLSDQGSGELLQLQSVLKSLPTGELTDALPVLQHHQQQRQQRLPQDLAQQNAASVMQAPVTDSATGQGPSPKPAPGNDEVPKFPFSIVKPRPSSHSRQSVQRQRTASPSDLPIGAVAVAPSEALSRSSLPSSASLDAHAHAELHSAPMHLTPPTEQMSLSQQHAAPSTDQAKVPGVTTCQAGPAAHPAGANADQAGPSASTSDHTAVLHSTSTPQVEASQLPSATSAPRDTANFASLALANHEAAVAAVQALAVQTAGDERRHSTRDRSMDAAKGLTPDRQDSAELLLDNAKTALYNQEGNRSEARGVGRLETEHANQYGHRKRKTCDT
ncbi:TPA: hypothetical protein ACH3X1_008812 [Trebouxia sp. C0004]